MNLEALMASICASGIEQQTMRVPPEFSNMKTNSERLAFVQKLADRKELKFPQYIEDKKMNDESEKLRKVGNEFYKETDYVNALLFYNKSIMLAKKNSMELALAFGNRSAVMFEKSYFEQCLQDINRALENGYPADLRAKLLERKTAARRLLSKKKQYSYYEPIPQIVASNKNDSIPSASTAIKIDIGDMGRKIVATRNIEVGDILIIEKAFVVAPSDLECHCSECLELCFNMIPCDYCTIARFCSEDCRDNSWEKHHKYECKLMKTIFETGMEEYLLPLRITLAARDDYHKLETLTIENYSVYHSDRFLEVYNLMTNEDKMIDFKLYHITQLTLFIYNLLEKYSSFFTEVQLPSFKEVFTSLLLHNIQLDATNSFRIQKAEIGEKYKNHSVGCGLYPLISLLNHSCSPNVFQVEHGSTKVVRAIHRIKKDEEVFISYGVNFYFTSMRQRYMTLWDRFKFYCKCQPCISHWPEYGELPVIDSQFSMEIDLMHKHISINKLERVKSLLKTLLQKAKYFISNCSACRHREPYYYSYDWFVLEQRIRECYEVLGNKSISF